jgi:hypothetical protein
MAKILYSFKYTTLDASSHELKTTYIFEIKYINVPDTEPRYKRYQWFVADEKCASKLTFDSMEPDIRYFKEGLILNIANMTYQMAPNYMVPIEICQSEDHEIIVNYLDNMK